MKLIAPSRARGNRGLSLGELLVAMAVFSIITAGFVRVYSLGWTASRQGSEKMNSMQTLREAMNRFTAVISSSCPPTTNTAAIISPYLGDPAATQVLLYSTKEYAYQYVYRPELSNYNASTDALNPVKPTDDQFVKVRVFCERTVSPDYPGGQTASLKIDLNTPGTSVQAQRDDLIVARNIYDCTFTNVGDNSVLVAMSMYRNIRNAGGTYHLTPYRLSTRLFLPYYTNTQGGGG